MFRLDHDVQDNSNMTNLKIMLKIDILTFW